MHRHLARTVELETIMAESAVEDFAVVNDEKTPAVVALEVLERASWLPGHPA